MKTFLSKTLLTVVCLLCANCIVQAQLVRFVSHGTEYEDGATATSYKYNEFSMSYYWETQLKNFSDKDVTFTLRVEPLDNRHSDDFLTLATPSVCISLNSAAYETDVTLAAGEITDSYRIEMSSYMGYSDSYSKFKLQIFNQEDPNDNTTLYVILDPNAKKNTAVEIDGIYYNIISPTGVEITGSSTTLENIVIPQTVKIENVTYNVISIGNNAFLNCNELNSVTIPESVGHIGENAFTGCGLSEIHCKATTPPQIYYNTFDTPENILLYVPVESVEAYITDTYWGYFYHINKYLVDGIYYNILSDTEVQVTHPALNPYFGEIVIPERVEIDGDTFNVISIGEYAFYYSTELTKITIPNSVTSIADYAFEYCTELKVLIIADGNNELDTDLGSLFYDSPIETLYLGRNTPNSDFSDFNSLTSVTFGNGVTSIGDDAFNYCNRLKEVTIPESVALVGKFAFQSCSNLTKVVWNAIDCKTPVEGDIIYPPFYNCSSVNEFILGDKVKTIPTALCYKLDKLTSVTIPNSVTSIGQGAFSGCTGLTSITIGNSVTSIGEAAFYNCTGLTSITIPNSVTSIGEYAFGYCSGLISIDIPNSVTSIADYAFEYCTELTSITIGNSVTSIGEAAFYNCTELTSIDIPNSVTSIGYAAFYNCTGLTSITIPNSVTSIGEYAFGYCSGLISIDIPNSVTSIADYAFEYCTELTSITIGNSVTSIGEAAFYNCTELTSIDIPNSVTSIGYAAFYNCTGLTSITIGNSVTSIGQGAFYNCTGLTSITIPNSVTSIGEYAFGYCSGLISATIGCGVQEIGDYAFYDCDRIKDVYAYPTVPPTIYTNTFTSYVNDNATLHVTEECRYVYENTMYWKYFVNILEDLKYTAVENIEADINNVQTEYYDLSGRRVARPEKGSGIYIVKQGSTVKKVVL